MKSKIKLLIVMVISITLLFCLSTSVLALTDGDWEYRPTGKEITITNYLGEGEDVIIPSVIAGNPVTKIEVTGLFSKATSVTFPSSVKSILAAKYDNNGREKLTSIILSEGLEEIGGGVFAGCSNLKSIEIPTTVKKLHTGAFINSGIVSIDLSYLNAEIGDMLFSGCYNLEYVLLPNMKSIPFQMFLNCHSLKNIDIPHSVKEIENDAFKFCSSLTKVILPAGLERIDSAFTNCEKLEEIIIPIGTFVVSDNFYNCKNLKAVYVPSSVTHFYGAASLIELSNCIVYCSENSACEAYCLKNNIPYIIDNSVDTKINVLYNDVRISFHSYNQNPEVIDGRTLVPLRAIFEAMKAEVEWDGDTNTVIAKRGDTTISIQLGANIMHKNGVAIPVDVPAQAMNGRTMIPVRVIAESFGADVQWNGNGNIVCITELN